MKIKVEIEIDQNLYEKAKNLESIGELRISKEMNTGIPVTFNNFIEYHIEKLFKYSTITQARKDIKLYHPRRNYSLDRAIQIITSLYSERVAKQIKKEIEEK